MASAESRRSYQPPRPRRHSLATPRLALLLIPFAALLLTATTAVSYMYSPAVPAAAVDGIGVYTAGALPSTLGSVTWRERGARISPQPPVWTPIAGVPVAVRTAGDLAVIDARAAGPNAVITVSLRNTGALAGDYTILMLPIQVYQQDAGGQWAPATDSAGGIAPVAFLTLDDGSVSINVGGGHDYYAVTVAAGGSIRAARTLEDATHTLSPTFRVTHRSAR